MKYFLFLIVALLIFITACSDADRINPFDTKGDNYNPPVLVFTKSRDTVWINDAAQMSVVLSAGNTPVQYAWYQDSVVISTETTMDTLTTSFPLERVGENVITVKGVDQYGTYNSVIPACTVVVREGRPTVSMSATALTVGAKKPVVLPFTGVDSNGTLLDTAITVNGAPVLKGGFVLDSAGVYSGTVTVMDDDSLWATPIGFSLDVHNYVPTATLTPAENTTIAIGGSLPVSVAATDTNGTVFTYSWSINGVAQPTTTNTISISGAQSGTQVVVATVTDEDGFTGSDTLLVYVKGKEPLLATPINGTTPSTMNVSLEWVAGFLNESYEVRLDVVNPPVAVVSAATAAMTLDVNANLKNSTTYYWQVIGSAGGESAASQVWSFTTPDYIKTTLLSPALGETLTAKSTILSWQKGDYADSFVVYCDVVNPPVAVVGNTKETTIPVSGLAYDTPYYWAVVGLKTGNTFRDSASGTFVGMKKPDLPEGIVAWYPFNGDVKDESGNENHGTNNGALLTVDRFGNPNSAMSFDGVDDYVSTANNFLQSASVFSISLWIRFGESTDDVMTILGCENSLSERWSLYVNSPNTDKERIAFGSSENGSWGYWGHTNGDDGDDFISDQLWHHVVLSFAEDGGGVFILDGDSVTTYSDNKNSLSSVEEEVWVGANKRAQSFFLDGLLDDIQIYNRALTEDEITTLYKSGDWKGYPPVFTDTVPKTGTFINTLYTDTLRATDPEGRLITFTAPILPAGMTLTDSILSWMPATVGIYPVTVLVTDPEGNSDTLSWEVTVTNGLVARYTFDNGSCVDVSGNGNDGINNGAVPAIDRFGNPNSAMSFDGVDDFFSVKSDPDFFIPSNDGGYTVSCWYYATSLEMTNNGIITKGYNTSSESIPHYSVHNRNDSLQVYMKADNGITSSMIKNIELSKLGWVHITASWDNSSGEMKLYLNNKLLVEGTYQTGFNYGNNSSPLVFMNHYNRFTPGLLDDIQIYNRALSVDEISTLYKEGGWNGNSPKFIDTLPKTMTSIASEFKDTLRAFDPEGEVVTFVGATLPAGMVLTDSVLSWTTTVEGRFPVSVIASDPDGNSDTLSWEIIVTNGLVAYFPFSNGSLNDFTGSGKIGTNSGATPVADRFGNADGAMSFDGVDDYIEVGSTKGMLSGAPFTAVVWYANNDLSKDAGIIGNMNDAMGLSWALDWAVVTNSEGSIAGAVTTYNANGSNPESFSTVLQESPQYEGYWAQLVLVWNNSDSLSLYRNGKLEKVEVKSLPNFSLGGSYPLRFAGSSSLQEESMFSGKIDDVQLYNRALTADEIVALYNDGGWNGNPPVFTDTLPKLMASVSAEYINTLRAFDPENGVVTFSGAVLPSGMTLTDSVIRWSPTIDGVFPVSIVATDVDGNSDTLSWEITINSSLVAYYPFNMGSSQDCSGNGYNATIQGATSTVDRFGVKYAAKNLDGKDDQVLLNKEILPTSQYAFSFWIKLDSYNLNWDGIMSTVGTDQLGGVQVNLDDQGKLYARHWNSKTKYEVNAPATTNINKYYHIVVSFDGTSMTLWIDNEKQGTIECPAFSAHDGAQFGRYYIDSEDYFDGTLDDIYIFNSGLTTEEIASLYHEGGWDQ